ncbi:phytoene desaturase family protein [Arcobacter sp. FWKO B]|uniref:phytoene desaturase family protein n=1 Tax=Arcobacter sp. FWKO B TaxID=2593672 RepID=UPI0018A5E3DC|nr:NAD(P)-binding protein [Arcobacter sp. FWKO B]QOG12865.1 NAD(P)/FAD-dependent oxidoreductase [Arcobacter sp. FWKO B]
MEKNIYDYAIIGGGIGGCAIASKLSKNHNTLLLEKEPYLGGCSATFKRKDTYYNIGATTFATYQEGLPVYDFFKEFNLKLNLKLSNPAITVLIGEKTIHRYKDIDKFIDEINTNFYHKNNKIFWEKVKKISDLFYKKQDFYYDKKNLYKTFYNMAKSIIPFSAYFLLPARVGLNLFLPKISKEYLEFIDNQVLIVAQEKSENINFLTLILSLGYALYDNYYAIGGMGKIFDELSKHIQDYKLNENVLNIEHKNNLYEIRTKKDNTYYAKNIILNKPIFKEEPKLYTDQSAFVVYLSLKSDEKLHHHYQIIADKNLKHSISNSIFVSFSDYDDNIISPKGVYSITISTHTKVSYWENLSKLEYEVKKQELQDEIIKLLLSRFPSFYGKIIEAFSATPQTFGRYIKRKTLGGIPLSFKNLIFNIPSPKISDHCFYVGDTIFPAQGWPGVIIGAKNLYEVIKNG